MGTNRFVVAMLLFVVVLFGCIPALWAQSATTGALTGTVSDSTGAPVPGVSVVLLNTATGQAQTTTTGPRGAYGFATLGPGTYSVKFMDQGFKTAQQTSLVINVSEAPILDAKLEPGNTAQVTECQCQLHQAATTSGLLVDSKTVTAVPLTTRNFTQLLSMSSGSTAAVNNAGLLGTGSQSANVNGNIATGIYTVNGAASANTVPNPDTIAEFKIQTSQYDAGYGARVPSTNLITQSGGNQFHGDAWEFVRNDIFNANAFFLEATGQPKPNLKQNQFGGTFGGPIKKDRLFFFGSYQGTHQTNGLDPSSFSTFLSPPLTNDRSAPFLASQFCPAHFGPAANTFAGGKQLDCNDQSTATTAPINPVALALLQMKLPNGSYVIPTPQTIITSGPQAGLGLSSYSLPSTYRENQYVFNADYQMSKRNMVAGRLYYARTDAFQSFGSSLFASTATPNTPGFPQNKPAKDFMTSLSFTSLLTKNLVNEARGTFTRSDTVSVGVGDITTASIGMMPVDPFFTEPPDITIQGPMGGFRVGNAQNEAAQYVDTYQAYDNLSWIHGRHSIRTGVFFYLLNSTLYDTGPARGKITFQNFTDFLLGLSAAQNGSPNGLSNIQSIDAKEGLGPNGEIVYANRTYSGAAFVEDDIKLSERLTTNFGLRWEYFPPSYDVNAVEGSAWPALLNLVPIPPVSGTYVGGTVPSIYNPNTINPYTGQPFGPPPAGVFVRPGKSFYQNGTPLDNFSPRFGISWQPGRHQTRLTARAGYGWFYQLPSDRGNAPNFPLINTQPFAQIFENAGASNSNSTFQQPFPVTTLGFQLRSPSSRLTDRVIGPRYEIPLLQQWNLNLQYAFSRNLSLDVGYVGSYGNHLLLAYGSNQPLLAAPGHLVNCGLPTLPADLGVNIAIFDSFGINANGCVTVNTASNAYLRVPVVGETPTALLASQSLGLSWYNSMQVTLRKQLSNGLTFQVAYTFSKAETNTTVMNDQTDLALDWARASFDRTHRLIANFDYELPTIGRRGFVSEASQGWSVSGIVIIQSGLPLTLTDIHGGAVYGFAGPSTITLCPGATYASLVTHGQDESRLNDWFGNTSAVVCPAPALGSDGSTGYGNAGQSIVNGPGQFNTDLSFGKTTTVGGIREDGQLAFRVEFYNALNHPQFSNPGTAYGTSTFGVITQTSVAPRLIQFGLKYIF